MRPTPCPPKLVLIESPSARATAAIAAEMSPSREPAFAAAIAGVERAGRGVDEVEVALVRRTHDHADRGVRDPPVDGAAKSRLTRSPSRSVYGSEVAFWIVDPLVGHPLLTSLPATVPGFSVVAHNADHALDYVKAPLFTWTDGRSLPPSGGASSDDLQDLLSLYLDQCKAAGGEIYAFGAKFDQNLHKPIDAEFGNLDGLHGVHDIHMNQGNVGQHSGDNGVFHDGGLILKFPDRYLGLFWASRPSGFNRCRRQCRGRRDADQPASCWSTTASATAAATTTAAASSRHVRNLYRARADQSERPGRRP